MKPFGIYSGVVFSVPVLIALLVCLIPTTIGGLLSAIGIAGMDRLLQRNVLAMSGRAVEAAGDVDVLLLDKTGTITLGNRMATAFIPAPGVAANAWPTPRNWRPSPTKRPKAAASSCSPSNSSTCADAKWPSRTRNLCPSRAQTRMSGVDFFESSGDAPVADLEYRKTNSTRASNPPLRRIRKGAAEAMRLFVDRDGGTFPKAVTETVDDVSRSGGTPLVVAEGREVLGVVQLKDMVKGGIKERFAHLRKMGIRTVMITGDNPLTAAAIAAEAGVDDFHRPGHARGQARSASAGNRPPATWWP